MNGFLVLHLLFLNSIPFLLLSNREQAEGWKIESLSLWLIEYQLCLSAHITIYKTLWDQQENKWIWSICPIANILFMASATSVNKVCHITAASRKSIYPRSRHTEAGTKRTSHYHHQSWNLALNPNASPSLLGEVWILEYTSRTERCRHRRRDSVVFEFN